MFGFGKILIQDDETAIDTTDLIDVLPDDRTPADACWANEKAPPSGDGSPAVIRNAGD